MARRPTRRKVNGDRKRIRIKDPVIARLRNELGMMGKIALELGIRRQATSLWRRVPANRVLDVERITGIPRHEIRPDYYPPPKGRRS